MMFPNKIKQLILLMFYYQVRSISCHETFFVPFQSKSGGALSPSINEWIEFPNPIASSAEFTACQWIKTKYFNMNVAVMLWSYCIVQTMGEMRCIQMYLQPLQNSANRDLIAVCQP